MPSPDKKPCTPAAGAFLGSPASMTTTERRDRASVRAPLKPAAPPPTTTTSYVSVTVLITLITSPITIRHLVLISKVSCQSGKVWRPDRSALRGLFSRPGVTRRGDQSVPSGCSQGWNGVAVAGIKLPAIRSSFTRPFAYRRNILIQGCSAFRMGTTRVASGLLWSSHARGKAPTEHQATTRSYGAKDGYPSRPSPVARRTFVYPLFDSSNLARPVTGGSTSMLHTRSSAENALPAANGGRTPFKQTGLEGRMAHSRHFSAAPLGRLGRSVH